jgi:hypothetical protein
VLGIIEDEAGGLVDRRGARAGGRVGLRAGMDGQRVETLGFVAHLSPTRKRSAGRSEYRMSVLYIERC